MRRLPRASFLVRAPSITTSPMSSANGGRPTAAKLPPWPLAAAWSAPLPSIRSSSPATTNRQNLGKFCPCGGPRPGASWGRAREKQGERRRQSCIDRRSPLPWRQSLMNHGRVAMRRFSLLVSVVVVVLAGVLDFGHRAPDTGAQDATPAGTNPSPGQRAHIDLAVHFPWHPALIGHPGCKPVGVGFFECLIYASDDPDAPLVAVEEVVDEATYNSFDPAEQQLWHSNVEEAAAGADPNRPAPSLEEAAAEAAEAGGATYGKLILLGDSEILGDLPLGSPRVIFPRGTEPGMPLP